MGGIFNKGTQGYTGVHRGTQGYTGVHRHGYIGVHRDTQGYTDRGYTGVHIHINRGAAKRIDRTPCEP